MIDISLFGVELDENFKLNFRDENVELIARGHALFSGKGSDIVCSSISVLVQTTVFSVSRIVGLKQKVEQRDGLLKSSINIDKISDEKRLKFETLLGNMIIGILEVEKNYPNNVNLNLNNWS